MAVPADRDSCTTPSRGKSCYVNRTLPTAVRSCGRAAHGDSTACARRGPFIAASSFSSWHCAVQRIAWRAPDHSRSPHGAPTGPRQLGPGAIVSHGDIDYVVRGSVTYREGPFVWWEHLLEGGEQPIWFSVEDDDGRLKLAMWVSRKDLQLQPGGEHVVDDVTYRDRSVVTPDTPPRARRACRRAATWTSSTTPTPTRPRCSPSSAGRRTCRGRFPPANP